jgi:hypothetical protein
MQQEKRVALLYVGKGYIAHVLDLRSKDISRAGGAGHSTLRVAREMDPMHSPCCWALRAREGMKGTAPAIFLVRVITRRRSPDLKV